MNKTFPKFAFQASVEQDHLWNMEKFSFWGVNKNVNFSTEFQYCISKGTSTLWPQQSFYYNRSFSQLWTQFDNSPLKYWFAVNFLRIFFCLQTVLWKKQPIKQSVKQICAPALLLGLSDSKNSYKYWGSESSFFCIHIAQSDTRNIEDLISWLQKLE